MAAITQASAFMALFPEEVRGDKEVMLEATRFLRMAMHQATVEAKSDKKQFKENKDHKDFKKSTLQPDRQMGDNASNKNIIPRQDDYMQKEYSEKSCDNKDQGQNKEGDYEQHLLHDRVSLLAACADAPPHDKVRRIGRRPRGTIRHGGAPCHSDRQSFDSLSEQERPETASGQRAAAATCTGPQTELGNASLPAPLSRRLFSNKRNTTRPVSNVPNKKGYRCYVLFLCIFYCLMTLNMFRL